MRLDQLLAALDPDHAPRAVGDSAGADITSVTFDARQATPGALHVCLRGGRHDGHDHAAEAVANGAVALVVDHELDLPVPQLVVADTRLAMAPLAAAVAGDPSHAFDVVGITGTNGKTTTSLLVQAVLEAAGRRCGVLGTLQHVGSTSTTPEAPDLQRELARMRHEGCVAAAVEVTSHALGRHRVDATRFAAAAFTNLTQDHLDEHGTMEAYFAAKARLFEPAFTDIAVVFADDPWGRRLLDGLSSDVRAVEVSMADATDLELGVDGCRFTWRGLPVVLHLGGRHNVANALVAAAVCSVLGVDDATIAVGLGDLAGVDGRFQRVVEGQPFEVLVDYSHTPDALHVALAAAREAVAPAGGRVLAVFGCGGDRDPTKRGPMGKVAATEADEVWVTDDNPRSEDPDAIRAAVLEGASGGPATIHEVADRRAAIAAAVGVARAGDAVLVAGKGHETYQEAAGVRTHFDDAEEARTALARLGWTATAGSDA